MDLGPHLRSNCTLMSVGCVLVGGPNCTCIHTSKHSAHHLLRPRQVCFKGMTDLTTQMRMSESTGHGVLCTSITGCWEGAERPPLRPGVTPCPLFFFLSGDDHKGHPRTSYYQYGLSILALCVQRKRVHDSVVGKLLYAVEHDHHLHQGHFSVGE